LITGIRGILESKGPDWVQLRVGGSVSFQVFVPASILDDLGNVGDEAHVHTRLYIRDDEAVLYGFPDTESLRLFQMLNGVSGIGPRTSLALLSTLGPQSLAAAVATGDLDTLSRVPGVGRKSAGRLVLELRGKLEDLEQVSAPGAAGSAEGEVVTALMALGYTANESRRMAASVRDGADMPLEERLRRALQQEAGG
jgi:Holliday junction DNA helicase RuvA